MRKLLRFSGILFFLLGISISYPARMPAPFQAPEDSIPPLKISKLLNVDPTGDYQMPPSAFQTVSTVSQIKSAISGLSPTRVIVIKAGTYELDYSTLVVNASQVIIMGETGNAEDVVLKGAGFASTWSNTNTMFKIDNQSSYVTIADLTIEEVGNLGVQVQGPGAPFTDITMHNVHFRNIGERMFKPTSVTNRPNEDVWHENFTIRYCIFENTKMPSANRGDGFNGDYISAIDAKFLKNFHLHHNIFKNIAGPQGDGRAGIFIWHDSRDILIEKNVFTGCDRGISLGNPQDPDPEWDHHNDGAIIRNNFFQSTTGKSIEIDFGKDIKIYNNTMYGSPNYSVRMEHNTSVFITNNIFPLPPFIKSGGGITQTNNITSGLSFDWFVDPGKDDFRLRGTVSELSGKAISLPEVTDDFDGNPRGAASDIGAHTAGGAPAFGIDSIYSLDSVTIIIQFSEKLATSIRTDGSLYFITKSSGGAVTVNTVEWMDASNQASLNVSNLAKGDSTSILFGAISDINGTTLPNLTKKSFLPDFISASAVESSSKTGTDYISISPNPFNPSTKITLPGNQQSGHIKIYDGKGTMVKQVHLLNQREFTWNANHLSNGIYFLRGNFKGNIYDSQLVLMK